MEVTIILQLAGKAPASLLLLPCHMGLCYYLASTDKIVEQVHQNTQLTGSPRGPMGPTTPLGPGSPGSPC